MSRPRLLDLFCGAGGCAKGYQRAGFEVWGVDHKPQPRYCGEDFMRADAVRYLKNLLDTERGGVISPEAANACGTLLSGFDAIHASPPCQRYSAAACIHDSSEKHPDLVPIVRDLLIASGKPWVMENVERSELDTTVMLCGSMFGLGVRRHRLFESSTLMLAPPCGSHRNWYASVFGGRCVGRQRVTGAALGSGRRTQTWDKFDDELATARKAMGIDWMDLDELSEAIPPAYTEFVGRQLMAVVASRVA